MKEVFSVEKFKECCKRLGLPNEEYEKSCEIWANKCDGLTKEEMNELGYVFNDNWAIEVEEQKEDRRKIVIPFNLQQFKDAIERIKTEYYAGNLDLVGLFEIETLEYYYERVKENEND